MRSKYKLIAVVREDGAVGIFSLRLKIMKGNFNGLAHYGGILVAAELLGKVLAPHI
jgi:hypothetical protein